MGVFWEWFYVFSEFFSVVYGPVILAALPIIAVAGFLTGLFTSIIDFVSNILFGGK